MAQLTRRVLLAATLPALALTACSGDGDDAAPSASAPPAPSPTEVDGVPIQPDSGGDENPMPAEADDETTQAAIDAATATMEVWVQGSTLDEQTWRSELNATLTTAGQAVASRTWGYRVLDHEITGDPVVIRANAATAVLHITTDYTTYEVTVIRTNDGTWLTSNLTTELREGPAQ